MWIRSELKQKGKAAFKNNYWKCVVMSIITTVLFGGAASTSGADESVETVTVEVKNLAEQTGISIGALLGILVSIVGVALVISVLWNVFLIAPIGVGIDRFFVLNSNGKPGFGELPYAFKKGRYLKSVGVLFLSGLFIALWSFLLVIPGIIKMYEYRLVSYILAEDPDLSVMECLHRSKEMMKGHKWNAFVLDLSFIGWHLLAGVTCGVVGIFYVYPYVQATDAELYLALKNEM